MIQQPTASFDDLHGRIQAALSETSEVLSPATIAFVTELLDVGELRIALETIVGALAEHRIPVKRETVKQLGQVATAMGRDEDDVHQLNLTEQLASLNLDEGAPGDSDR